MDFYSFIVLLGWHYKLVKNSLLKKKEKTSRRKRWLFEEIIHQYGGFAESLFFRFIYSFKSLITQMILDY
jgi:hypothetical protein